MSKTFLFAVSLGFILAMGQLGTQAFTTLGANPVQSSDVTTIAGGDLPPDFRTIDKLETPPKFGGSNAERAFEAASAAGVTTSAPASLSLLTLLKVVPFGPAPHVSDYRLLALIHMYMLDADNLRATVPQTAERFELVGARQSSGAPILVSRRRAPVADLLSGRQPRAAAVVIDAP